jgi:hypothetical protein
MNDPVIKIQWKDNDLDIEIGNHILV